MNRLVDTESSDIFLFVFGTQRSGTTLLCRMLSAHPELFIQNELDVRKIFVAGADKAELLQKMQQLVEEEQGCSLPNLLIDSGKHLWGLKDPELTYHTEELALFMPQTRCIVIVRDARAVVASYINNKWGLGTNAYTGALRWQNEVKIQLQFCKDYPDNTLLLRFEDLLTDTRSEIDKVCEFLDLPFHSDMLNYSQKGAFFKPGRENINTFKDPDKFMVDKWHQQLSQKQKGIVDHVCGSTMQELGYSTNETPYQPSKLEVASYLLHQNIVGEFQLQYRWRLSKLKRKFA